MRRYISTLRLAENVKAELYGSGYVYVEDLRPDDEILLRHGVDLHRLLRCERPRTALDSLYVETKAGFVPTLSYELDGLIGGGVHMKKCTEFCGLPGSGKTQMCLQLCVNVRVPRGAGGLGGRALYVDTRGGFSTKRLREIAVGCVELVDKFVRSLGEHETIDLSDFTADRIMGGVYFASARSYESLLETVGHLDRFLRDTPNVKLIAIDSISFPFGSLDDKLERIELLYRLFAKLQRIADRFDLAVVVTNEMTHRFGLVETEDENYLVPCLGDTYAHRINSRILLSRAGTGKSFSAKTVKNPTGPVETVEFVIDRRGVRPVSRLRHRVS